MTLIEHKLTSVDDLIDIGLLRAEQREALLKVGERYAIAITPTIANAIKRSAPNDPIARQFLPSQHELELHSCERDDPIGDNIKSPAPAIVHRYADRVLLKITSVCPVYCRFCFRREMVGSHNGESLSTDDIATALRYISATSAIWEVILTGGDPFILSPRRIRAITEALSKISHVKVMRWHTRVPIVDPDRVTGDFIAALKATRQTVFVGLHTNHAQELTSSACAAISRLTDAGIPLISQTVLLKGINDDVDVLEALMRRLIELRIKPYYLHHGDLAPGTAHFRTTIAKGRQLMFELRRRLSGIALPTYVLDLPGAHGKVSIERHSEPMADGGNTFTDRDGKTHRYEDVCAVPDIS